MRIRKKILSFILAIMLLCSFIPVTTVTTFAANMATTAVWEAERRISDNIAMPLDTAKTIVNGCNNLSFITDMKVFYCQSSSSKDYSCYENSLIQKLLRQYDNEHFPYSTSNFSILQDKGEAADFNQDTWDAFVGMLYQSWSGTIPSSVYGLTKDSDAYRHAITGIVTSDVDAESIEYQGITYYSVNSLSFHGEHMGIGTKCLDMNLEAGGDFIYIYVTRDQAAGKPITDFFFQGGSGHMYNEVVSNIYGGPQDFNAGTDDDACYLWYNRCAYSKSEIASAKRTVQNGAATYTAPVEYRSPVISEGRLTGYETKSCNSCNYIVSDVEKEIWGMDRQETWYAASGNVNISNSVRIHGNVNLILTDGCSLTVTGNSGAGINVPAGCTLRIYGQSGGTGTLIAESGGAQGAGIGGNANSAGGNIIITGGIVTATGSDNSAGIGGSNQGTVGDITITGGNITANGGDFGAGIGTGSEGTAGKVVILGGKVYANSRDYGSSIGIGNYGSFAGLYLAQDINAIQNQGIDSVCGTGMEAPVDNEFFKNNHDITVGPFYLLQYKVHDDFSQEDVCIRSEFVSPGTAYTEEMLAAPEGKSGYWVYTRSRDKTAEIKAGDAVDGPKCYIKNAVISVFFAELESGVKYVTLKFHGMGGDYVEQDFIAGNALESMYLEKPNRKHIGWFYDKQFQNQAKVGDIITEDTDLYLKENSDQTEYTYEDRYTDGAGSVFSTTSPVILIVGSALLIIAIGAVVFILKKKKKIN